MKSGNEEILFGEEGEVWLFVLNDYFDIYSSCYKYKQIINFYSWLYFIV